MINKIHACLHPTASGWDPVSRSVAENYADATKESSGINAESGVFGHWGKISVSGLDVLDLGGGPGHQAIILAQLGARVTWHDVSRAYLEIATKRAKNASVHISFTLDYMDHALRIHGPSSFDIVVNRICWYYCMNDRAFASMIMDLLRPGGMALIDNYIPNSHRSGWRYKLNRLTGIKIGHPFPAPGAVPALFARLGPSRIETVYVGTDNELITVVK
jgi:2-polyprenyl-3-methyl-5-hydroxy-6-metoxy-1,4-benzoquinol methylase